MKFGGDFLVWYGPTRPRIVAVTPETIEQVLKTDDPKGFAYTLLHPWLGLGLLTSAGRRWQVKRKLLTPAFHFDILREFGKKLPVHAQVLCDKLKAASDSKQPVELMKLLSLATLDVIGVCGMGIEFNAQKGESSQYIQAVESVSRLVVKRMINPLVYSDWVYFRTANGKQFRSDLKILHDTTDSVIRERQQRRQQEEKPEFRDFLEILLDTRYEDGTPLNHAELREEVDTFLFEGHDTTASGLLWTLALLAQHPDVADRVKEEVDSLLMDRTLVEFEDAERLEYTQAVIKEALRVHSPVPSISRRLAHPIKIGKVVIPANCGVEVNVLPYGVHHNPQVWDNPEVFDPQRFLGPESSKRHPFAYVPFSGGPRNCIGRRFAMMELVTVVAMVTRHFRLHMENETKVAPDPQVVLRTSQPLLFTVARRDD